MAFNLSNPIHENLTVLHDPPLEAPRESPRVGINDPDFKKLTAAEKLNDSNYRQLVYQTHPDEGTCLCEPPPNRLDGQSHQDTSLVCRSGCNNFCCWRMKGSSVTWHQGGNANNDDKVPFAPTYCVGNKRESVAEEERVRSAAATVNNGNYCCGNSRLRGGGEYGEEGGWKRIYLPYGRVSKTMLRRSKGVRNCVDRCRLAGGANFGYASRFPLYRNQTQTSKAPCCSEQHGQLLNHDRGDYYRTSNHTSAFNQSIASACVCPGRDGSTGIIEKRDTKKLQVNKSLPVIDHLVKAFQDTQDFVDSLGKVPGLAGLGLMDPHESPYFGRCRNEESNFEGTKADGKIYASTDLPELPNPQCTGPCNAEAIKSRYDASKRGGVIREAVPSFPEPGLTFPPAKLRKRDDKDKEGEPVPVASSDIEPSPCGEPGCKAKRRKTARSNGDPAETNETKMEAKSVTLVNPDERNISKLARGTKPNQKIHSGRMYADLPRRSVDKNARRRSSGKSGKRSMRFVYSAGDAFNNEVYSHKNCVEERQRVPGNMGWLWNLNEIVGKLKPRQGWRPGAIGHRLREILRAAKATYSHSQKSRSKSRKSSSSRSRSGSPHSRGKRGKDDRHSAKKKLAKKKLDEEKETVPPPTLHIHRKDGTYYITMYPIKQETMDVPKLEIPMKPLQFKIAKNRDDASVATSSTASDMEIEFSPPAAVNRYRKQPNVVHVETQAKQQEIINAFKIDDGVQMKHKKKTKHR